MEAELNLDPPSYIRGRVGARGRRLALNPQRRLRRQGG